MKRLVALTVAILVGLLISTGEATNKFWWAPCLTGGGSCLDGIPVASISDGDGALVVYDNSGTYEFYPYRYESSSATADDGLTVIAPDDNGGNGRWLLANYVGSSYTSAPIADPYIMLDSSTASADWWIGTDQANTSLEFRQSATTGSSVYLELTTTGLIIPDSKLITFDESAADPNDADIQLSATDGVFKIKAANGANNEDITIDLDATANTATIGTASGVTLIDAGSIGFASTGIVSGAIKVISVATSCTIGTDCDSTSTRIAYGGFIEVTAAITVTLPAVAQGMNLCVYVRDAAEAVVVDPNASDGIRNGTAARNDDGHYVTSTGAGNYICMIADSADGWTVLGKSGTWTDE